MDKGCIHIYEGDGKGKTTASVGLAVRCAGSGQKVLFTQFLKGNSSNELNVLEQIPNLMVYRNEKEYGFVFCMDPEEKIEAKNYYREHFRETIYYAKREHVRLLVMDELIDAYTLGMVDPTEVQHFLLTKPDDMEVVMTGHSAPEELVHIADYVTHMAKKKHPFDMGLSARVGIEM